MKCWPARSPRISAAPGCRTGHCSARRARQRSPMLHTRSARNSSARSSRYRWPKFHPTRAGLPEAPASGRTACPTRSARPDRNGLGQSSAPVSPLPNLDRLYRTRKRPACASWSLSSMRLKLGDEYEFTTDGRDIVGDYLEHDLNEWDDAALGAGLCCWPRRSGGGEVVAVGIGSRGIREVLAQGSGQRGRPRRAGLG